MNIDLIIKEIFDRIVSLIALIFISPFFLIIAIFIKLDSKGPVFFFAGESREEWKNI